MYGGSKQTTDWNVEVFCDKLGYTADKYPKVRARATEFFELTRSHVMRQGSTLARILASIYLAAREAGVALALQQIVKGYESYENEIARCYRVMQRAWNIKVERANLDLMCETVGKGARVDDSVITLAKDIIKQDGLVKSGDNPLVGVCGALYAAAAKKRAYLTQVDLAAAAGLSETSVRRGWHLVRSNHTLMEFLQA